MSKTIIARTLDTMRNHDLMASKVAIETNKMVGNISKPMFGIINVLIADPKRGVIGVYASESSHSYLIKKLTFKKFREVTEWLKIPGTSFELWRWYKKPVLKDKYLTKYHLRIYSFILLKGKIGVMEEINYFDQI